MEKCQCYIHSLKQGENHVLGEATILKRLGDNDYLAEYNGVKCHAIFNPFAGRYFVDDVYGVIPAHPTGASDNQNMAARGRLCACPLMLSGKEEAV